MKLLPRQIEFDHKQKERRTISIGSFAQFFLWFFTTFTLVFLRGRNRMRQKRGLISSLHCVSPSSFFLSSSSNQIILALGNSQIVLYLFISSLYVYGRQHEVIIMRLADRGKVQLVIQLIGISKSPSIFPSFWRATHSPLRLSPPLCSYLHLETK